MAVSSQSTEPLATEGRSTSSGKAIVRLCARRTCESLLTLVHHPWITDGVYGNYQQPPPPPRTKSAASSRAFAATPPPPSAYQAPPPRPSSASSNRSSYSQSRYGAVPPPAPFTASETAYSVEDPYARSTGPSPPPRPPSASAGRPVRAPAPGSSTSLSPLVANRPLPPQRTLPSTSTAYGPPAGLPPASNGYAPYESTDGQASCPPSSYSGLPPSAPFSHPVQAPPLGSYVPAIVQAVSEDPLGRGGEKFKKVPVINFGFGGRLLVCYPELGTANQYGGFGAGESEVEGDGRTVRLLKLSEILTEGCKSTLLFHFLISDDLGYLWRVSLFSTVELDGSLPGTCLRGPFVGKGCGGGQNQEGGCAQVPQRSSCRDGARSGLAQEPGRRRKVPRGGGQGGSDAVDRCDGGQRGSTRRQVRSL